MFVDSFTFDGSANFAASHVSAVTIYEDSIDPSNELQSEGGFDITSTIITFDDFGTIEIPADGEVKIVVTVDIVDNSANDGHFLENLTLTALEAEDDDDDTVTASGLPAVSQRDIEIAGQGTLAAVVDNTDSETLDEERVLGNSTSSFVASFELTAQNEDIVVEELEIELGGTNAIAAIKDIMIYAEDKVTLLGTEQANTAVVTFDNLSGFIVEVGSENIYVKVTTEKIGLNQPGAVATNVDMELEVTDAKGKDSDNQVVAPQTASSTEFDVYPVNVTSPAVAALSSTTLLDGANTTVARFNMAAQSNTNTDTTDGSSLITELETITFEIDTFSNLSGALITGTDFQIRRSTNGSNGRLTGTLVDEDSSGDASQGDLVVFNLASWTTDQELTTTTVQFEVRAQLPVDVSTSDAYFAFVMPESTASFSPVTFGDDDVFAGGTIVLGQDVDFAQVSYDGN